MAIYQNYLECKEVAESIVAVPMKNAKGILKNHGFTPAEIDSIWCSICIDWPLSDGRRVYTASGKWQTIYKVIRNTVAVSIQLNERLADEEIPAL